MRKILLFTLLLLSMSVFAHGDPLLIPYAWWTYIDNYLVANYVDISGDSVTGNFYILGDFYDGNSPTADSAVFNAYARFLGVVKLGDGATDYIYFTGEGITSLVPKTNDSLSLGTTSKGWDMYATDILVDDSATVDGVTTLNGKVYLGDATADDITFTGYTASDFLPKTTGAFDLGSAGQSWGSAYIDSTAIILITDGRKGDFDTLVVNTEFDMNGRADIGDGADSIVINGNVWDINSKGAQTGITSIMLNNNGEITNPTDTIKFDEPNAVFTGKVHTVGDLHIASNHPLTWDDDDSVKIDDNGVGDQIRFVVAVSNVPLVVVPDTVKINTHVRLWNKLLFGSLTDSLYMENDGSSLVITDADSSTDNLELEGLGIELWKGATITNPIAERVEIGVADTFQATVVKGIHVGASHGLADSASLALVADSSVVAGNAHTADLADDVDTTGTKIAAALADRANAGYTSFDSLTIGNPATVINTFWSYGRSWGITPHNVDTVPVNGIDNNTMVWAFQTVSIANPLWAVLGTDTVFIHCHVDDTIPMSTSKYFLHIEK